MREQNESKVIKALGYALTKAGKIYDKEIDQELINLYAGFFESCNHSELIDAIFEHIGNPYYGRKFPMPADIMRELEMIRAPKPWE